MSISVELTDKEIAQLRELTQQEDVAASLKTAVLEYIRYRKRLELIELSGRIEMQDNWQELEEAELKEQH
jgi:hypothetical protein